MGCLTGMSEDLKLIDEFQSGYSVLDPKSDKGKNFVLDFIRHIRTRQHLEDQKTSTNTTKEATETPWPCKFSDSLVCAAKSCSDTNCDIYEPA